MSYYELPNGAKVFAAGAFTLAEAVWLPDVQRVIENLWTHLAHDDVTPRTHWQRRLSRLTLPGLSPSNDPCAFESCS
jgi:hypothetical protein